MVGCVAMVSFFEEGTFFISGWPLLIFLSIVDTTIVYFLFALLEKFSEKKN